jgi:hypothetical protein
MTEGLQLGRAFRIVAQTMPYVVYRAIVYGVICAAVAFALLILLLIGRVFGGGAAGVLFVIGLAAGGFGARLVREYVLYLLKAGHVALIAEIVTTGKLPENTSQTEWAKERVMHYFKEVSVLALVDQLVKGIIRAINRTSLNVMTILPIPGTEGAAKVIQRIVDFSLTYIDESIIAYTFKTKNENVFDAAKTGIVLYCQSWKGLLKNAVALTVLSYVFVVAVTIVFLVPLGIVAVMLPETWGTAKFLLFIMALFFGFSVKWIVFDPIACTSTILTFFRESESLEPDPEWEARIERASEKFRELKEKAAQKFRDLQGTPPVVPHPEASPTT